MKQEKQNSKNDLVYAFKKMDINDDGFISFSELKKALTMVNIIVTACNSPGASCSILH
jgi:Ca2+-binding EF-hand superfamily protein